MGNTTPKIVITGTGRAGTTFLVQLLTELGFDTGFTRENWHRHYSEHCAAGLEHDLAAPDTPRIVKNPALCVTLPGLLASGAVAVEHAIIPIRHLDDAAQSRIRVGGRGATPGGLWGTGRADQQKPVLAEQFHQLVHALVEHDVPHTFLAFPRFARDPDYTWRQLAWLFISISHADFLAAFARVARPELIHDFSRGLPADAGQPARDYQRGRFRARVRRARRRLIIAAAAVAAAVAGFWWFRSVAG